MSRWVFVGSAVLALAVLGSCTPRKQEAPPPVQEAALPEEFLTFWTNFRGAVLSGDQGAVAALVKFPFETRGQLDDAPVLTHDRDAFPGVLEKLLSQDPGLTPEPSTMRQLIEANETAPAGALDAGGQSARVGVFVFVLEDGHWRLTRGYLDE
jgi:hypothetical protein